MKKEKEVKTEFKVVCGECDCVFIIGGNDLEIECPECGFEGDQNDFDDADADAETDYE